FHFISSPEAAGAIAALRAQLEHLARDGRAGRVIREGRTVVLVGRPNAGKSSLFNALAGAARAIVTDVAGTTRDLVGERVGTDRARRLARSAGHHQRAAPRARRPRARRGGARSWRARGRRHGRAGAGGSGPRPPRARRSDRPPDDGRPARAHLRAFLRGEIAN